MSQHRPRPLGPGFIRMVDNRYATVWVLPLPDLGGLVIHARIADLAVEGMTEVFTVQVLRGSGLLAEVLDKPHRIRWAWPVTSTRSLAGVHVAAGWKGHDDVWEWLRVVQREHTSEPNWPGRHRRHSRTRSINRAWVHRHPRFGTYPPWHPGTMRNWPRPVVRALREVTPTSTIV